MPDDSPKFIVDGIGPLDGGMNSGVVPQLLPANQVALATNCTFRGGFITHRPPIRNIALDFGTDLLAQQIFLTSLWQGASYFKSEYGHQQLVASVGGHLWAIVPDDTAPTATIADVSIQTDLNSNANKIAWLWQSERWMICNDGESLPLFYDGATTRRSFGPSHVVGTASVDFVAPAIGSTVNISLASNYTGPYNQTVYIDGTFYQVNSSAGGVNTITLANRTETPGAVLTTDTILQIPSNFIARLRYPVFFSGTSWMVPPYIGYAFYGLFFDRTFFINSYFESHPGDVVYIRDTGTNYFSQILPTHRATGFYESVTPTPQGNLAQYSAVYFGNPTFTAPAGLKLTANFTAPAIDANVTVQTSVPFNGAIGSLIVINGGVYQVIAVNNAPPAAAIINATNINDTAGHTHGPTGANGLGVISTVPELPIGKMGAYGLGRNWMALADGRSFIGSDIVGGSSGSPALNNRDSVLRITENTFLTGGTFVVPGNIGDITAMVFTANLDTSLGQGPLQVGTSTTIFSCQAPLIFTDWQKLTNPILTESLKGKGPLGQYSTILVNSDTIFRAVDGISSLILARRDFDVWGNVPISREMTRVITLEDTSLMGNASHIEFDNRVLMTSLPIEGPRGIFSQGVLALNLDPISSLRGKAQSIYDGLWTGLNVLQFVAGRFGLKDRAFAFCFNTFANRIELWELLPTADESNFDNGTVPITWNFETRALFNNIKGKDAFQQIELLDGEIYLSDIRGVVNIQSWYRPDYSQCWQVWHNFDVCGNNFDITLPTQYRSRVGLGTPSAKACDPTNNRPYRIGNNFQVRFQITGSCKFMGAQFKAKTSPETYFSVPICADLCTSVGQINCESCKDQGDCLRFPLVFYNFNNNKSYANELLSYQVECPDGSKKTVYVPAGTITFMLPFPVGFTGPYPPLVLACAVGGLIIRFLPDNATQDQIDAIVNEMIYTCGEAIANNTVNCSEPSVFVNETVFFVPRCPSGTVLTYSGTLPEWITLDAGYSILVGLPGFFTGNSQADANAAAQAALNGWAQQHLTNGSLNCAPIVPPGCGPQLTCAITAIPGLNSGLMGINQTTRSLWICDTLGSLNLYVMSLDPPFNIIHTIDMTTHGGAWQAVHDTVNGQMLVLSNTGDLVFFDQTTYAEISSLNSLIPSTGVLGKPIAFDPTRGRCIVQPVNDFFNNGTYHLIDCGTRAQIMSFAMGAAIGTPIYCQSRDKYFFTLRSNPIIKQIDPATGVVTDSTLTLATPLCSPFSWIYNGIWIAGKDQIWFQRRSGSNYTSVVVIDTATMTELGEVTGVDVFACNWITQNIVYDSCSGSVWISDLTNVVQFDTATLTEMSVDILDPDCVGLAFDPGENALWIAVLNQVNTPCPPP